MGVRNRPTRWCRCPDSAARRGGGDHDLRNTTTRASEQRGGDGDDWLVDRINADGNDSTDRYSCGAGADRVDADVADIVGSDSEQVTRPVRPAGGGTLVAGPAAMDTGPAPGPCGADVLATAALDLLSGDGGRNRIFGLAGDDRISGRGGDDWLYGGAGRDRVRGQAGRDLVSGGGDDDRLAGGRGSDRLEGGGGDDILRVGGGRNRALGGGGPDTILSLNGRRDVIRCGRGEDRVRADARDRLRGRERVTRAR